MGAPTPAHGAAQAPSRPRASPRPRPSTLAQCLLRRTRTILLSHSPRASEPRSTQSSLTGEPDAGNLPVRFGGRGEGSSLVPTPIGIARQSRQSLAKPQPKIFLVLFLLLDYLNHEDEEENEEEDD